jgi:diguanylate cyclase (GGDEF)-like protein
VQGMAARYGGDEFVLLSPEADLERAVDIAEEIRAEILSTTFCAGPGEIQPEPLRLNGLTCSIGVATLKQHIMDELPLEESKSTLLRLADAAMYVAKANGGDRYAQSGKLTESPDGETDVNFHAVA